MEGQFNLPVAVKAHCVSSKWCLRVGLGEDQTYYSKELFKENKDGLLLPCYKIRY